MSAPLRRTPLFDSQAGAKLVAFAGWEMPVSYSSLTEEHLAVRSACGLFDVSHMGELLVSGPGALSFLQSRTSNDLARLCPGRAQYTFLLNDDGGVVDDIIIYQLSADRYLLCVNAANTDKDFRWLLEGPDLRATVENHSDRYAQIALQGPASGAVLARASLLSQEQYRALRSFSFSLVAFDGAEVIVARTGYTGEDGVEIFTPPESARALWETLLAAGAPEGIRPAGLGARDTLRLEASYPLYGHELREDIPALASGLAWAVKLEKGEFIGQAALARLKREGLPSRLVGAEVLGAGIVRENARLYADSGEEIGFCTSGTKPPTLNRAVFLAYVRRGHWDVGDEFFADVRGHPIRCRVVALPFYRRPST